MPRLIHTGQALVDYVFDIPHLPIRGGNVYAGSDRKLAGGAVNILLAAVRNGAETVHAGAHGTGPNGDLIRGALHAEGVELTNPPVEGLDTGICVCLLESAERTFVTTLGAERHVTPASLQTSDPRPGDVVCIDGYTLVMAATAAPMLEWLHTLDDDVLTVLDPGADFIHQPDDVRRGTIETTRVWTSNLSEAVALVEDCGGEAPTTMAGAADALVPLLAPGTVIVVRDGPRGCAVRANGVTSVVEGFPQDPIDTNGAGDAHTGILLANVLSGARWEDAARRANAGAAIKVTRLGPSTAPTAREIDEFLAQA